MQGRESGCEMLLLWCVWHEWDHWTGSDSLLSFVLISLFGREQARLDPQILLSGRISHAHVK